MKLNIIFVATALAYGSSFVAGQYYDQDFVTRDLADLEEFDARDFYDVDLDARDYFDDIFARDYDEDFEDVFAVRLDSHHFLYIG